MKFIVKLILIIFVLLFGLAFHIRNHQLVTLDYYVSEVQLSFSVIILIAVSIGVLLGILVSIPIIIRTRQRNSRLEKKIKDTKKINRFHVMPED